MLAEIEVNLCGIIATVSNMEASAILLSALQRLTYRGYDSAGIVTCDGQDTYLLKRSGKINELVSAHEQNHCPGTVGMGHTRWATHGAPTETNAHPHLDNDQRYYVVCNGIIENYRELKKDLTHKGHVFKSDTDTEVIPALLSLLDPSMSMKNKIMELIACLKGSYALVVMDTENYDELWAARKGSPLLVARGPEGHLIGSDIPAILGYGKEVAYLEDNQIVCVSSKALKLYEGTGKEVIPQFSQVTQTLEQAEKGGYPHYMIKEIYEQPQAVEMTLKTYLNKGQIDFSHCLKEDLVEQIEEVIFVACGTAYNAGMVGQYLFESLGLRARAVLASEFHAFPPPINEKIVSCCNHTKWRNH